MKQLTFLIIVLAAGQPLVAQTPSQSGIKEFWFWPDYTLDRNAKNPIGPRIEAPSTPVDPLKSKAYSFEFFGEDPTERIENFVPTEQVPDSNFSIEMWILYHVNREVGVFTAYRNKYVETDPEWFLGLYGRQVVLTIKSEESEFSNTMTHAIDGKGWKQYWLHLVATYDEGEMNLYINGDRKKQMSIGKRRAFEASENQLETSSYLANEPYMQTGDMLKCLRIYNHALDKQKIEGNLDEFKTLVEEGKLYPNLFHFNAGPYLQMASADQMGMVWETSQPSNAKIYYGTALPLEQYVTVENIKRGSDTGIVTGGLINKHLLKDLTPGQAYFYNIQSTSEEGETIESGISTFKTAAKNPESFTFSVIGDTEARPHVNNRVAKLLWDERPEFLLNLGDLTDGGKENHKYQWNFEYFHALNQFTSRIPIYPVAGNGEGDLYWFNKYHILPYKDKAYYKFSYGNADYFMLDSNQKDGFAPGGEQYQWLEDQLKNSQAEWKFVAHHHAPYSSDENDYGDSWKEQTSLGDLKVREIVPLYEKYGVDVVFFGHLHTYQRMHKIKDNKVSASNGVTYIQAGGAGGNLEDFAPTRSWFSAKTFRGHHYLTVEVFGKALELRMYDSEGRMKDLFKIEK